MRAIAYTRVSTEEQSRSGLGLEDQRTRLIEEIDRRGWELAEVITDEGFTGSNIDRPGIEKALTFLKDGTADALVVAKLDRLSRSLLDFATLMEQSRREGWALVALDLGVDTSSPSGELMANVLASFAQYERKLIGQRTRDALAVKKRQGVRLGRPVTTPNPVRSRIGRMHDQGLGLTAIADKLNEESVPTARGGQRWYPSSVRAVLASVALDSEAS